MALWLEDYQNERIESLPVLLELVNKIQLSDESADKPVQQRWFGGYLAIVFPNYRQGNRHGILSDFRGVYEKIQQIMK